MTLILTELSMQGIVMAADSAITIIDPRTNKITDVNKTGWSKIVRVPKINAAISYWGMIGAITNKQFDHWLKDVIQSKKYDDIYSFAAYLAENLNKACHDRPLSKGYNTGIHVAGFSKWTDGQRRPVFLHIHNAHLAISTFPQLDDNENIIAIHPTLQSDNIKLFEVHNDFPDQSKTLEQNLLTLKQTYITRNGEYYPYLQIWGALQQAFEYLNLIKGFSIPANPNNLGSRKDYLQMAVETVIRVYQCSNQKQKPSIGGKAISLGISEQGYLLPIGKGVG